MLNFLFSLSFALLCLISTTAFSQVTIIDTGTQWKYYDQGDVVTSNWVNNSYNDSGWPSGASELGYGDGDEATTVGYGGNANNKHPTTYFRKAFSISTLTDAMDASVKIDDGAVVYVNGIEVFRYNMPSGAIVYNTLAGNSGNENQWNNFNIPLSVLNNGGMNLIAVEVHQSSANSSDLSLDMKLSYNMTWPLGIYINEFMAQNNNIEIPNHDGSDDWIELYNSGTSAVDISGYYITDKLDDPTKFRLPTATGSVVIPAKGYLVLICSDNPSLGANHVSLGLSAKGEAIGLYGSNGTTLIDSYTFDSQRADVSMGRSPVNYQEWKYFSPPTPGSANSLSGMYNELLPPPTFSQVGGLYTASLNLSLSTNISGATIYYTLDGSDPDPANVGGKTYQYKNELYSALKSDTVETFYYNHPIFISNRSSEPNLLSLKSSSYEAWSTNPYFPNSLIAKGTVVRAIQVKSGGLGESASNSYFVFPMQNRYSFPIVSLSLDERNMYDYYKGFYTPGAAGSSNDNEGNFNSGFRHSGYLEYFKGNQKVTSGKVDFKIHGGASKLAPRKSLRVYLEGVEYPFFDGFPQRIHKSIILRNSGNNSKKNIFEDALNQEILNGLKMGKQETQPAIVFINGEYWGIHNIRERIDEHYVETNYNVSSDSLDLIEIGYSFFSANKGNMTKFNALRNYIDYTNFSNSANYDSLTKLIDIENFIDYHISQIYLANRDWPENNNRFWSKKGNYNPSVNDTHDGRWRWLLYDTDLSNSYNHNSISELLGADNGKSQFVFILRKLISNQNFKALFCNRFADLLNTNFSVSRTTQLTNLFKETYGEEIEEHRARWNTPSISVWNSEINNRLTFYTNRPSFQRTHIRNFFGYSNDRNLTVNVSDDEHGYIKVNTIDILPSTPGVAPNPYPWTGVYFQGLPVMLMANPNLGYKFKHWLNGSTIVSTNDTMTVNLTANQTYLAVFEEDLYSDNLYPLAKHLKPCAYEFTEWSAESATGSFPANTAFVYFDKTDSSQEDPILNDLIGGYTTGDYDLSSRSRINGLGGDGISFINTGSGNSGYPGGQVGGLLVGLSTLNQDSLFIKWTAGTVTPNIREYAIRFQYRVGDKLAFQDVLDGSGNPYEYVRNSTANHSQTFENVLLPESAMGKPYIQLLWRYYHKGNATSGARAELRLDDISIYSHKKYGISANQSSLESKYGVITSKAIVNPTGFTNYEAAKYILLEPGFKTNSNAVFKAEINTCN